jgi:hypothetical protein
MKTKNNKQNMEDQEFTALYYANQYWDTAEGAAEYFAAGCTLAEAAPVIVAIQGYIAEGAEGFTDHTPSERLQNLMDAVAAMSEPATDEETPATDEETPATDEETPA